MKFNVNFNCNSNCITDLGSLIGNTQCENFWAFLPFRFYVKSILVVLKPPKTAILTIWVAMNFELWQFLTFSSVKFFWKSKFNIFKTVKTAFLTFWNQLKLISRKIIMAGKLLNFHCMEYPQSKSPIRLPRSVPLENPQNMTQMSDFFFFQPNFIINSATATRWSSTTSVLMAQKPMLWCNSNFLFTKLFETFTKKQRKQCWSSIWLCQSKSKTWIWNPVWLPKWIQPVPKSHWS